MKNLAKHLISYHQEDIAGKTALRKGEIKLGERVRVLEKGEGLEKLADYRETGVKYVLLGIPESVGPMANHGNPGAENAWAAFLGSFLNMQSNRFLEGSDVLCLGRIATEDLQSRALSLNRDHFQELRDLCAQLDDRVFPVVEAVAGAGLVPVIIGGGHNNAYPIIKGVVQGLQLPSGIGCINCDPHADFRLPEGRHSGNGFSYAYLDKYLKHYYVVGLQENYSSEAMLQFLDQQKPAVDYAFSGRDFPALVDAAVKFYARKNVRVGLELDLDGITGMPASAFTPVGIEIEDARRYIQEISAALDISYLHLAEGAPRNQDEEKIVGKSLAFLVSDFIRTKNKREELTGPESGAS